MEEAEVSNAENAGSFAFFCCGGFGVFAAAHTKEYGQFANFGDRCVLGIGGGGGKGFEGANNGHRDGLLVLLFGICIFVGLE